MIMMLMILVIHPVRSAVTDYDSFYKHANEMTVLGAKMVDTIQDLVMAAKEIQDRDDALKQADYMQLAQTLAMTYHGQALSFNNWIVDCLSGKMDYIEPKEYVHTSRLDSSTSTKETLPSWMYPCCFLDALKQYQAAGQTSLMLIEEIIGRGRIGTDYVIAINEINGKIKKILNEQLDYNNKSGLLESLLETAQ